MKNFLLILSAVLLSFNSYSQDEKSFSIPEGNWALSGSASFNTRKSDFIGNESNKFFMVNLSPSLGYALDDNLLGGIGLGYGYSESEDLQGELETVNGISIAPYIKKFIDIKYGLAFSLTAEAKYYRSWVNDETFNVEYNNTECSLGVRPGISYLISDKLSIDSSIGNLGYSYRENEQNSTLLGTSKHFYFDLRLSSVYWGLTYYF